MSLLESHIKCSQRFSESGLVKSDVETSNLLSNFNKASNTHLNLLFKEGSQLLKNVNCVWKGGVIFW